MSRFDDANERLLSALDRLERIAERQDAAAESPGAGSPGAGSPGEGAAGPDGETEALREALDASRRANAALRASRDDVSVRLDGAIERLSRVLGE